MKTGQYNNLIINRFVDFGAYLIDDEGNEVLLPKRYLTGDEELDDKIEVFVYHDSENRPVATTEHPFATVGQFCAATSSIPISTPPASASWQAPSSTSS